jgi:DNA-binding NtrC family response regulator
VKGAFTDARGDRIGRLQAADGGTLFLDEVGNLPLHLQPKLLTALEQRQVVPVGANKPVPIDVRVIAATNLPPEQLSDEAVPPGPAVPAQHGRDRAAAAARAARGHPGARRAFVALYAKKYGKPARELPPEVMAALKAYDWPGNVRALRHAAERAVILADNGAFTVEDFSLSRSLARARARRPRPAPGASAPTSTSSAPRSRWSSRR